MYENLIAVSKAVQSGRIPSLKKERYLCTDNFSSLLTIRTHLIFPLLKLYSNVTLLLPVSHVFTALYFYI